MMTAKTQKTKVGAVDRRVLEYTAGQDIELDLQLVTADCIGTAAHVTMLSRLRGAARIFTAKERKKVIQQLVRIMRSARQGKFRITLADQDVHLAVERALTKSLGELGKKVHTARSRNDQVAVDLRLFAKEELLGVIKETAKLATGLLQFARKHERLPMVGRTHMQPAMPSSVGLWASAYAEDLSDDLASLIHAYSLTDQCPLGSAAGYGVPFPIDRKLVSELLDFGRPMHNVLHAANARGKNEAVVLSTLAQVMMSLSRFAQDVLIFSMPEFGYFRLPETVGTGSSIMPQKNNPAVLELVRAKAAMLIAEASGVHQLVNGLPGGYNRDLQETKAPLMHGFRTVHASLQIVEQVVAGLKVDRRTLRNAFTAEVFAADKALEMVAEGMPFRDAYEYVKAHLGALARTDPEEAVAKKTHLGGTGALRLGALEQRFKTAASFAQEESKSYFSAVSMLLGVRYPLLR